MVSSRARQGRNLGTRLNALDQSVQSADVRARTPDIDAPEVESRLSNLERLTDSVGSVNFRTQEEAPIWDGRYQTIGTPAQGRIPSSVQVGSGTASVSAEGVVSFTGVSSISLNQIFDGLGTDAYAIHGQVTCSAEPGGSVYMRLRNAGADLDTPSYYQVFNYTIATGWGPSPSVVGSTQGAGYTWSIGFRQYTTFDYIIKYPKSATYNKEFTGQFGNDGSNQVLATIYGRTPVVASQDGFSIFPASAVTMTGWVKVVKL